MRPVTATLPDSQISKEPEPSMMLMRNLTAPSGGMMVARWNCRSSITTAMSSIDLLWSLANVFQTRVRYPVAGKMTRPSMVWPTRYFSASLLTSTSMTLSPEREPLPEKSATAHSVEWSHLTMEASMGVPLDTGYLTGVSMRPTWGCAPPM